jgi:hypothetical protein
MTRACGHLSAAILLLSATPLHAQRSDRRVLDRAAIARLGWHRLGEIANALPPGSVASIDGFNSELRGSRLGFSQTNDVSATWIVRLDGQLMPMRVGGLWVLDEIPVSIVQLDSVVIAEGPQLTDGRAAVLGTIDLYTRLARGASIVADYQHGDETGDPGPYRYTARTTPNVEKLGPFANGAIAGGTSAAALDLAARYASLNITDQAISNRLGTSFPGYQSDVNASGASGVATLGLLGGRTYIVGGRGRFTGFFPTSAMGINQQARIITSQAGVAGWVVAARRTWRYSIAGTGLNLDPLGNVPLVTPAQERTVIDGLLEAELLGGLRAGIGTLIGRQQTLGEHRRQTSNRAWMGYSQPGRTVDFSVARVAGGMRYSASGHVDRAINDSDRVGLTLTRLETWRFSDFAWMDRAASDSSGTGVLDLRVDLTTRPVANARPTWYARAFSYSGIGTSPVRGVAAGVTASTAVGAAGAARVRGEVSELVGEAGLGERSTPGGYVEGDLSTRTAGGFLVALAGRYAPRTHWSGSMEGVPATQRFDFSVNKAAWHNRIRAQFIVRNLLDAPERMHPEGAQWSLRTHLAVTIALPSGAGAR